MNLFNQLYNDNYRLIYNVVSKMTLADKEEVLDIVQEVFIHLYQQLEKGKTIEYPRSWLYKVAVNRCIDCTKKRPKYEKIESASYLIVEDNSVETQEKHTIIKKALNRLKTDERVLAILYSEGLSYKEMAEVTGIRFSSIGKTLSRTLTKLGDELKKLQYELY